MRFHEHQIFRAAARRVRRELQPQPHGAEQRVVLVDGASQRLVHVTKEDVEEGPARVGIECSTTLYFTTLYCTAMAQAFAAYPCRNWISTSGSSASRKVNCGLVASS